MAVVRPLTCNRCVFAHVCAAQLCAALQVTVATKIDGPIKLLFPAPARASKYSMLGLGDIVIPGAPCAFWLPLLFSFCGSAWRVLAFSSVWHRVQLCQLCSIQWWTTQCLRQTTSIAVPLWGCRKCSNPARAAHVLRQLVMMRTALGLLTKGSDVKVVC